ncbi:MAG: T9SS type A sorting domain-containing protein [Crocinitomicaceae bacterium]
MKNIHRHLQIIILFFTTSYCFGQSDLRIECYPTYELANGFYLNNTLIEYGCCGNTPSIYLGVADDTCAFWNNETDLGNHNAPWDSWVCKPRLEWYFVYRQNDYNQLNALDSVINQVIPDNHVFFMYTPGGYDHTSLQSVCPDLAQTFVDQWGSGVETADMIILFGIKGFPQSYELMVGSPGDTLIFNHTICPDCSAQTPTADFVASETVIDLQSSGDVLFTNNSLNADSSVLYFGDGNSSNFMDSILYNYSNVGTYETELIVYNGSCSDTMMITITVINSVNIDTNSKLEYGLQIFPNPSNAMIKLTFKNPPYGSCFVYDSSGRNVEQIKLDGATSYSASSLESGMYSVVVRYSTGETELFKILVE